MEEKLCAWWAHKQGQDFAGIGVNAAKAALQPLDLIEVDPEVGFVLPEDEATFRKFRAPSRPHYALVNNIDNLKLHRHDVPAMNAPRENNAIFDRRQLIGRWDFDTATMSIVWLASVRDKALEEAVHRTEAFIREDLGDARRFSLDSPKSRVPCIAALRNAAAGK